MKIHVAVAGGEEWTEAPRSEFRSLAKADSVGRHALAETEEEADVILFVNPHQHLADARMHAFRQHPSIRRFPEKCYVFDERDFPLDLIPGVYVSMPRHRFRPSRHRAFSYPRLIVDTRDIRDAAPDVLFSFLGRGGNDLRSRLLSISSPDAIIEDTSHLDFFGAAHASIGQATRHYKDVIGRSHFVLCPRGFGTASFRLFEILAAARVPVILSDEWVPPSGIDWDACAVRIPEASSSAEITSRLTDLLPMWSGMSVSAGEVFDSRFDSSVWFDQVIEEIRSLRDSSPGGLNRRYWLQTEVWRTGIRAVRGRLGRTSAG